MSKKITQEQAQGFLEANQPPILKAKPPHAFGLYAELDTTKQQLKQIKPFNVLVLSVPPGLNALGREIMIRIFRCFARQGVVSEGLIGDMMFGFSIPTMEEKPLSQEATWEGLEQLRIAGYVKFQAADGNYIDSNSDQIGSCWVRYTPKLLEMIYEK